LTITAGTTEPVVALRPARSNAGSAIASIAAQSSGMASPSQPAITALIAIFSTVHSARSGGNAAINSSGKRPPLTRKSWTRASVGGINGRPSPQPRAMA